MKRLFLLFVSLLLLLHAQAALAAFGSVGTLGANNSITSNDTITRTLTVQLDAGNLGICLIAKNNANTADGTTSELTSFADPRGNTWSNIANYTNGQSADNAGATIAVVLSKIATNVQIGDVLTATLTTAEAAKAITCWEFSVGAGKTAQIAGSIQVQADDGVDPSTMTISGLSSKEYLLIRATAGENNIADTWTATTNYTNFTQGVAGTADNGSNGTSMKVMGEFRILTTDCSASACSSDPTHSNNDSASVYFALEEVDEAASRRVAPPIIY